MGGSGSGLGIDWGRQVLRGGEVWGTGRGGFGVGGRAAVRGGWLVAGLEGRRRRFGGIFLDGGELDRDGLEAVFGTGGGGMIT